MPTQETSATGDDRPSELDIAGTPGSENPDGTVGEQHGSMPAQPPASSDSPDALEGLARLVGPVHQDAARLADPTDGPAAPGADPRQVHRAGDAAVAAMCRHLATMEQAVYPTVAQLLPGTRDRLARLRTDAHQMLVTMRDVQSSAQGDTYASTAGAASLRHTLAEAITDHARQEESLLREFDQVAAPAERERLVAEYERMLPRAPSRPHPYLFRGPLAGRLGYHLAARFDHLLDTMDGREVAGRPVRQPGKVGPWGGWLLGRQPGAPARRTESGSGGSDNVLILPRSAPPPQVTSTDLPPESPASEPTCPRPTAADEPISPWPTAAEQTAHEPTIVEPAQDEAPAELPATIPAGRHK
jgi:hypothetical protein